MLCASDHCWCGHRTRRVDCYPDISQLRHPQDAAKHGSAEHTSGSGERVAQSHPPTDRFRRGGKRLGDIRSRGIVLLCLLAMRDFVFDPAPRQLVGSQLRKRLQRSLDLLHARQTRLCLLVLARSAPQFSRYRLPVTESKQV